MSIQRNRCFDNYNGIRKGVTTMKCELCNANTTQKKVRKQHWFNGCLYIVECWCRDMHRVWWTVLPCHYTW